MKTQPRPPALRIDNLTLSYGQHPAVRQLSCELPHGSLTAIVGPNGAGKSSLLEAIAGRLEPRTGSLHRAGLGLSSVAYLAQQARLDRSFPLRVLDFVMLGAWPRLGPLRGAAQAQRLQARRALETVRLAGFENRPIAELSVGQFQRVLFARLILQDAPLILLDEPFAAIDSRTSADLMAVVAQWHAEQRTVIAVLHDVALVRSHFPSTLLLARERIAHGASALVLTPENLDRARRMAEHWDARAPSRAEEPGAHAIAPAGLPA